MNQYHKINTVYKRDPETNHKSIILGDFALPEFEYLAQNMWVFTEKVDGTNTRVMFDGTNVKFGGKSDNAQMSAKLVDRLRERFSDTSVLSDVFGRDGDVCLYGEGYGAKIQSGGKYRDDQDIVLFDVKIGDWWLQRKDVEGIAEKLSLDVVPIVGQGTLSDMASFVTQGLNSQWGDFEAEGIVARPSTELKTRSGDRVITKLKARDFANG